MAILTEVSHDDVLVEDAGEDRDLRNSTMSHGSLRYGNSPFWPRTACVPQARTHALGRRARSEKVGLLSRELRDPLLDLAPPEVLE